MRPPLVVTIGAPPWDATLQKPDLSEHLMIFEEGRRYIAVSQNRLATVNGDERPVYAFACGDEGLRQIAVPQNVTVNGRPVVATAGCIDGQYLDGWRVVAVPQNVLATVNGDTRPVYAFACCPPEEGSYYGSGSSSAPSQSGSVSAYPSGSSFSSLSPYFSPSGSPSGSASGSVSGAASGLASGSPSGPGSGSVSGSPSGSASGIPSGIASGHPSGIASGVASGSSASGAPSGSLSGSSSTVGTVTVGCCPNSLLTTLYATISGPCSCLIGSYPIVWDGVAAWGYTGPGGSCTANNGSQALMQLYLRCQGGDPTKFQLQYSCGGGEQLSVQADPSSVCSPTDIVFNLNVTSTFPPNCCSGQTITITVTEGP